MKLENGSSKESGLRGWKSLGGRSREEEALELDTPEGWKRFAPGAIFFGFFSIACLALVFLTPIARAEGPPDPLPPPAEIGEDTRLEEHWYRLEVGGEPAGWMLVRELVRGDRMTTESTLQLRFTRGRQATSIGMATRFVEKADGQPVSLWSRQELGEVPVEVLYVFGDEAIRMTRRQGDEVRHETLPPLADDWATPGEADEEVQRKLASGAEVFTVRTVDPSVGPVPIEIEWRLEERGIELETPAGRYFTDRFRQTMSIAPQLPSTVHVTADGLIVRTATSMMGLEMVMTLADRETVMEDDGAPELLVGTFVEPDRPIERPRELRRAIYRLRVDDGFFPNLPSVGAQRAVNGRGEAEVRVEIGSSPEVEISEDERALYLRATTFLDHEDPEIVALHGRALEGVAAEPSERAEALRAFVHGYLSEKDLDTAFATAGEVARRRAGDCTEHAVLLAALLRAEGIPSRVVTGLLYTRNFAGASDIFGYHMWTQALIGKRWIDLDATLANRRFDAAHVALATAALDREGEALVEMAKITPLIGRLEIEVLETEP